MQPPAASPTDDPARLRELVDAIPGVEQVRDAAGALPIYLIGGVVRDLMLGRERSDLDVVVEGDAEALARRLGGDAIGYQRFATAKVTLEGLEFDLARARAESYARPGALPDVRSATLHEDLARRDFSINAMAIPLHAEPNLIDPHGGRADLDSGAIRVLHERSFIEDPTRALRAARYSARFSFTVDPGTERLARETDLSTVSEDRIEAELLKLAAEPRARAGFGQLDAWGIVALPQGSGELIDAVAALAQRAPWKGEVDAVLAVHAAATGRAPGAAGRLRDMLGSAREIAAASPSRPSDAVELASGRGGIELILARALGAEWLDRYMTEWRDVGLEITGEDLLAAGVPEGPAVGAGLAEALRRKLDGEISERAEELRVALDAAAP
jgi:tRNA nucleotidyltransferase (CCA-adding enzyme)